jgi:long-chain fatty acid transport protein
MVPARWPLALVFVVFAAVRVEAAGFSLVDQGGRGLGSAYAGEVAIAEDPATLLFNPAGMTRLPGGQLALVGHVLALDVDFEGGDSTVGARLGGGPLHGSREISTSPVGLAPSAGLSFQVAPRWWVGLGFLAPFGFQTDYDGDWVGRYHANKSSLRTVEFSPSVGVKITDRLSLGASLLVQYADAYLSGALDLGGLCELNLDQIGAPPGTCAALGLDVQEVDGFVQIDGTSWGVGYQLGVLYELGARTRIGLAYRSRLRQELEGTAHFKIPAQANILRSTGALRRTESEFVLDLPEVVRLSVYHELDARWAVMAGVSWTHWKRFEEVVVTFANPAQPPLVEPEEWNDAWRVSLGVARRFGSRWVVQLGTAYDESPVPSDALRTPRIPDSDRVWITTGIGYHVTDRLRLDGSYAHFFGLASSTENADPVTGHVLRGRFEGAANLLGVQLSWRFR